MDRQKENRNTAYNNQGGLAQAGGSAVENKVKINKN